MQLPPFSLSASDGKTYSHQDLADQNIVLYIYPKDSTPGCTLEAHDFERLSADFKALGFAVFGLSKDSLKSHANFCAKQGLNFPLLSDPEAELITALGAWKEKSMYGKTFMGIERSTFVFQSGQLVQEWRKVKANGHAEAVLEFCQSLEA